MIMIIFKGVKPGTNNTTHLIFTNETKKEVWVPVPEEISNVISAHLRLLSTAGEEPIERGNDEPSN